MIMDERSLFSEYLKTKNWFDLRCLAIAWLAIVLTGYGIEYFWDGMITGLSGLWLGSPLLVTFVYVYFIHVPQITKTHVKFLAVYAFVSCLLIIGSAFSIGSYIDVVCLMMPFYTMLFVSVVKGLGFIHKLGAKAGPVPNRSVLFVKAAVYTGITGLVVCSLLIGIFVGLFSGMCLSKRDVLCESYSLDGKRMVKIIHHWRDCGATTTPSISDEVILKRSVLGMFLLKKELCYVSVEGGKQVFTNWDDDGHLTVFGSNLKKSEEDLGVNVEFR